MKKLLGFVVAGFLITFRRSESPKVSISLNDVGWLDQHPLNVILEYHKQFLASSAVLTLERMWARLDPILRMK